jgi:threonine synthase
MDVGKPSNFPRMMHLYNHNLASIQKDVSGYWCDDERNKKTLHKMFVQHQYQADPHGAIAYEAIRAFPHYEQYVSVFIETAHPAKFPESVEEATLSEVKIPINLQGLMNKEKVSIRIEANFEALKEVMM